MGGQEPRVAADCFIADNATLIGDVTLGEQASVWFNTVLRGDVEPIVVGARTNIQDGAILHTDPGSPLTIGADVTVGHMAMLHGCTVGDGSLIGIGAIVLSGARIGRGCIVGAGALVTEGTVVPDRTVVLGSPAKVARPVTEQQAVEIRAGAAHYVANAARYQRLHSTDKVCP
jgi:carbonic anhydrase/acetyltransferase-like protein (isoleucine patch superfamily)